MAVVEYLIEMLDRREGGVKGLGSLLEEWSVL